jgi:hypothetical protein
MTTRPHDHPLPPFDPPALAATWQSLPVCWKVLDAPTAAHELRALGDWVRWLATRYTLAPRTIPACWHRHGTLVEELSALRTGWLAAFAPDAPGGAALDWHDMFANTRHRLHDSVSRNGCAHDHRDDDTAAWLTTTDPELGTACEAE